MRTIRVSEIGAYLYCQRAWGYARQGEPSANEALMQAGTEYHRQHGRRVMRAVLLRLVGWGLILFALLALAAWWAWQVSGG